MESLMFPIGKFQLPDTINDEHVSTWIETIASFPEQLRSEVSSLPEQQLDTTYRPGGWSIRQIVHHCADSHLNSYIRIKLALTEETPTVKPYFEDKWAELTDGKSLSVEASLKIIEGLHARWVFLLKSLTSQELERSFFHPEHNKTIQIDEIVGFYAWHCDHHLAHIAIAKKQS
jgi:hypothetical protein